MRVLSTFGILAPFRKHQNYKTTAADTLMTKRRVQDDLYNCRGNIVTAHVKMKSNSWAGIWLAKGWWQHLCRRKGITRGRILLSSSEN